MTTRPGYVWDATASEWVEIGQAAVVAPVAYQASEPVSPATGDIWIDSDDEVPSVDSTLYYRWTKTMSGGETSLSGTDDNSLALEYTPGYESVFINGVLQVRGLDYVATTGTTVTGLTALTASDVVMVESIVAYSVGDTYTQSTLDGKFATQLDFPAGEWQTWTPTLEGGWANGNGTWTAYYSQIGKTVHVYGKFIVGSTTTKGTDMRLSVPVTAKNNFQLFNCNLSLSGVQYVGLIRIESASQLRFFAQSRPTTYVQHASITSAIPATWATNDGLTFQITYEAA